VPGAINHSVQRREVFPGVPIRLCNYHVQNAWLQNLVEKVGDHDLRMAMFKALRAIQALQAPQCKGNTAEVKTVMDHLVAQHVAAFMQKYSSRAPSFIKYFKKEWVDSDKLGAAVMW
jgi:hypothetical protein